MIGKWWKCQSLDAIVFRSECIELTEAIENDDCVTDCCDRPSALREVGRLADAQPFEPERKQCCVHFPAELEMLAIEDALTSKNDTGSHLTAGKYCQRSIRGMA